MVYNKHITLASLGRCMGQLAWLALLATGCGGGGRGDAPITPTPLTPGISLLAGSNGGQVNVSFSTACADAAVRARLDTLPPAGLQSAAGARGKLQGKTRT